MCVCVGGGGGGGLPLGPHICVGELGQSWPR